MKKKSMLIIAILLMSIGFAAISTTLIINGNAKVSENNEDFSVIFTAASIDGTDVYSTAVDETKKTITFTTSELKTLNQTSILTYEITNKSSNYDENVKLTCVPKEGTTAKYTSIKNKLENDATVVKAKSSVNGTLTVTLDKVVTESVTEEYTCKLEFNAVERDTLGSNIPTPISFESDSWSTIAANVKAGNTSKYNLGDTKEVDLGELGTHTVRITNMSECTNGETSETACGFVVEFVDMITTHLFNSTATNVGGWRDSEMRTYVNGAIYDALPSDLQDIIATTKVISGHGSTSGETNFETQDKLYLLSTKEISGSAIDDTVDTETRQLDYYKILGVTETNYGNVGRISREFLGLRTASSRNTTNVKILDYAGDGWVSIPANYGVSDNSYIPVYPAFRIA